MSRIVSSWFGREFEFVVYQQNCAEDRGVAIDSTGQGVLSRRVPNGEASLKALIDDVTALADRGSVQWACSVSVFNAVEPFPLR